MSVRSIAVVALALAALAAPCLSAPFVPGDDAQVLETLPEHRDPALAQLKRMQRASRSAPHDVTLALRFARSAIAAARASGDPRYLGQAQAALSPWWTSADAPASAVLLRATIKQSLHDFDGALGDLDRVVALAPRDAQAVLTRASVRLVVGRYDDAERDCETLAALGADVVADVCRADVESRTGRAAQAYARIARALDANRIDHGVRAWAESLAGEIAARRGDAANAQRHFVSALAADPADTYARAAYADWLLDVQRFADASRLVERGTRNDALLLRHVLALKGLPDREAYASARAELAARFDASRRRGDRLHAREEARYALHVEADAAAAVRLARASFQRQREPADVRVLAESARAAGDEASLRLAADWVTSTGLEDDRVQALLAGARR